MIARKLQPAPVNGDDVLAVLDRRLRELSLRRDALTAAILDVEKTTAGTRDDVSPDVARAQALLDGEKFVASRERPISQLASLHAERDVIDRALKIGRSEHHRLAAEKAGQIWASYFDQIKEIETRRVILSLNLQRTNRERETLREKITKAGGAGFLSTDSVDLLGLGDIQGEVDWAAERLIADGIATRTEIEKASRG